jgi:predicted ATP-grasp superfamily ATP-dependent carboligase
VSGTGASHRIVVTDGDHRAALATVRALGRAGHQVLVCSTGRHSISSASRYAKRSVVVPDALREPDAFVDAVAAACRAWDADVLLPMTDASMLAVLADPARVAPVHLPFVDAERFRAISDKRALLAVVPCFGIAVPEQRVIGFDEIERFDGASVSFPVVVKPARSVGEHAGHRDSFHVQYARDANELQHIVRGANPAAFPLMLQQRVVGPAVGIFLLLWDGDTIAAFAHRRLREKPPSGGVSVYRESIDADPALVARSRALLDHFGWRGVAMIEFKLDERTGTPYLMEINGRFWGSLQLAIDAGVDFPNLLIAVAVDHVRPTVAPYRVGVRSRWWWGDVDQLVTRLMRSASTLALPPGAPSRTRALLEFLRLPGRNDRNEMLRADDPVPFVRESIDWIRRDLFRMKP